LYRGDNIKSQRRRSIMKLTLCFLLFSEIVLSEEKVPTKEEILNRIAAQEQAKIRFDNEMKKSKAFSDLVNALAARRYNPNSLPEYEVQRQKIIDQVRKDYAFDEIEIQKAVKLRTDEMFKSAIADYERNIANAIKSLETRKKNGFAGETVASVKQQIASEEESLADMLKEGSHPDDITEVRAKLGHLRKRLSEIPTEESRIFADAEAKIDLDKRKLAELKKRYAEESTK
jgi:hypothetical protein